MLLSLAVHINVTIIFTFYICKNWQVCPELQKNQHSLFSPAFFLFEFQLVSKAPTKVTLDSNGESKGAPFWALCPFMTFFKVNLWIGVPGAHSLYTWPQKNMPAPAGSTVWPPATCWGWTGSGSCSAKGRSEGAPTKLSLHWHYTHSSASSFSGSCAELLSLPRLVNKVLQRVPLVFVWGWISCFEPWVLRLCHIITHLYTHLPQVIHSLFCNSERQK